jgi:3-oxoacyl-[acyl-carrier protein] reductase
MTEIGLVGKRALVAGAGYTPGRAGHGKWSALKFAAAGATVACIDNNEDRGRGIVGQIEADGGKAFLVMNDMTKSEQVDAAVREVVDTMGGIDVFVDIIGGARWGTVLDSSDDDWDWTIANNLSHVFYLFRAVGKQMVAQGIGGSMVALTSVDGIAAAAYHAPYGAAKAGVISLAKSFAHELGAYGIRVNTVAPGNVGSGNDDQPEGEYAVNGINPLAAPRNHDVADAVLFLSSDSAARITGQTIPVDGGATIRELWGLTSEAAASDSLHGSWPAHLL